jgi:hypothetical protein
VNVLKLHLQATVFTLLERGKSQREIHRLTGVERKTIRKYERVYRAQQAAEDSNSPGVATGWSQEESQIPRPRPPANRVFIASPSSWPTRSMYTIGRSKPLTSHSRTRTGSNVAFCPVGPGLRPPPTLAGYRERSDNQETIRQWCAHTRQRPGPLPARNFPRGESPRLGSLPCTGPLPAARRSTQPTPGRPGFS